MILDDILKILKNKSDNKAYTINEKSYTYKEVYKYVCNLYNFLLQENKQKKPVAIYGHKDIYMKVAFLACSFAGITYIPIDESITEKRVKSIIEQVNPVFTIGKNISKEQINKIMDKENQKEIEKIYLQPNDIYYIIFTSGSTGTPKGVKVTYKNLDSCVNWLKNITKAKNEVILNQANFSFDLSVADLYLSLVSESEHFILENSTNLDFKETFKQLNKSNCTMAVMTPSFADLLLLDKSFNKELMPNLKTILFCGEKLFNSTVKKLYKRFEDITIINSYGPSECTFAVTSIEITHEMIEKEIPAGKPKDDVNIFIINEGKEVEEGKIGEILIAGESVADGYLGNTNNKSFIKYKGKRAYLTGDIGYIENGMLYYKARKDKQIKYKGYRIELSDIEKNLHELKYIEKAVVCAKTNADNKVLNIIGFIKLKENTIKREAEIRKDLKERIPEYMCPKIKIIERFPINKNGKCDEKKLLEEY